MENEIQTGSSSISLGCRGLSEDVRPMEIEFFQCTPILILLFVVFDIVSCLMVLFRSDKCSFYQRQEK